MGEIENERSCRTVIFDLLSEYVDAIERVTIHCFPIRVARIRPHQWSQLT